MEKSTDIKRICQRCGRGPQHCYIVRTTAPDRYGALVQKSEAVCERCMGPDSQAAGATFAEAGAK